MRNASIEGRVVSRDPSIPKSPRPRTLRRSSTPPATQRASSALALRACRLTCNTRSCRAAITAALREPSDFERPHENLAENVQGPAQVAEFWCTEQPQVELEREVGHLDWAKILQEVAVGQQARRREPEPEAGRNQPQLRLGAMQVDAQSHLLSHAFHRALQRGSIATTLRVQDPLLLSQVRNRHGLRGNRGMPALDDQHVQRGNQASARAGRLARCRSEP